MLKINCLKDSRKAYDTMKNVEVAPQWIPDKEADTCMRCKTIKFNVVSRRVNGDLECLNFLISNNFPNFYF